MALIPTASDVRALFGISFLTRTISIIVQTVSPIVLVNVIRTPASMVGWMIAGFWIANAAGTVIAAGLIRNRNKSTLSGFVVLAFSFFGAATLHDTLGYAGSIILSGLGLSLIQAFLIPTLHMSGTEEKPHIGIANYSTALSLGMVAGPLAAAAAIWIYGFYQLFYILVIVSVAVLIVSIRIRIQKAFDSEDTRNGIRPSNIIRTLKHGAFANFYIVNFLYSLLLPILISYGGLFMEAKFHVSTIVVLSLFAMVFVLSSVMRVLFTRAEVRHFRSLLFVGFIILFISFALIGTTTHLYLFYLGFILFSVPHALIYPITTFSAIESAGKEAIISSTYIFATSSGIAEFISPLAAVPIIAIYSFSTLFLVLAPLALVALFLSFILPRSVTG